jgi:hypothetical protein
MIKQTKLNKVVAKVRNYKKYEAPKPNNNLLPPLWQSIILCAQKNGGKTYSTVQLLTAYEESGFTFEGEKAIMRTIWISGATAHSKQNAIIRTLKSLDESDIHEIDDTSKNKFEEIYEDILSEKREIEVYNEYRAIYKKFIKGGLTKLNDEELLILEHHDYKDPKTDPDAPTYLQPRVIFWILDDLINNPNVFGYKKNNFINKLIVKHRHDSDVLCPVNLIFITQHFHSIPVIIRRNSDVFVLFHNSNRKKIIEDVSQDVGSVISVDDFTALYDYTCGIEWGSLIISVHAKEVDERRFKCGWDTVLSLPSKKCDCISKNKPFGSCGKTS